MARYKIIIVSAFLLVVAHLSAQENPNDTIEEMFYISPSYAYQLPFGDLKNDFGNNSNIGVSFNFKTHKNWIFGLEYNFIFGKRIKKDTLIFEDIITRQKVFLNNFGDATPVTLFERGYSITANVGRIFPAFNINQNTGIQVKFGIGYLQHKIKAVVELNDVPQLSGDYAKLYDRLTSGIVLTQFIGYTHFGSSRLINFYAGVEVMEAFTRGRRDYQADLRRPYHDERLDILAGVKLGWMIPFRRRRVSEYYFY